jgi:signal transduction histidine kinase
MAEAIQNIAKRKMEISPDSLSFLNTEFFALQEELDIISVISRIRELTIRDVSATECIIKLLNENYNAGEVSEIIPGVKNGIITPSTASKLLQNMINTEEPLVIENPVQFFEEHTKQLPSRNWQDFGSYWIALASKNDKPIAVIAVSWKERKEITQQVKNKAETITQHAALAISNALEYQKATQAAQKNEEFAYTISHELKAPLTSVKSLTDFILEDYKEVFNDINLEYMYRIQSNLNHMESLIYNLLDFSQAGKNLNSFSFVPVSDLIDRALIILSGQIEHAQITIEVTEDLPIIYCDPLAMVQVFVNLLSNAIKHTGVDTSKPLIEIEYIEHELYDEFVVRDNGIGIAPEYHDKIFNVFYTVADEEHSRRSGIGLAIVKRANNSSNSDAV